jgi:hypothetical protein
MRRLLLVPLLAVVCSCKGPMAKIEAVRDGLASDEVGQVKSATDGFPVCQEPFSVLPEKGCFQEIAAAFGSKSGFNGKAPDQASAATVALVVVRERRGDWFSNADAWLGAIRTGTGAGIDALRLAVARQMAAAAPDVGKAIDDEKDTLPVMKAIGDAIPGACATYTALASGIDEKALPVEMMPDHSPCVQKDLGRKDGPGGTYGRGLFRAAEGAVALWKDAAAALREGLAAMGGTPRQTVDGKLTTIDAATAKVVLKKVPRDDGWIKEMTNLHSDAGVPLDGKTPGKADGGPAGPGRAH